MAAFKTVPLSLDWFIDNMEEYLKREEFIQFQEVVGFDYRDITDQSKREDIAKKMRDHSSLLFEIGRNKEGAFFPEKVYREDVNFYNSAPEQIPEADMIFMYRPMCYSLRLRYRTLNRVIIPYILDTKLKNREEIILGNLGSGLGKDLEYASLNYDGKIKRIINIDTDSDVVKIGNENVPEKIKDKVIFYNSNLVKGNPEKLPYDFVLMIGIICTLNDDYTERLLRIVHRQMAPNGIIAVSSSSHKMEKHDPFCSIGLQVCAEWALNCRNEDNLYTTLKNSGFTDIEIQQEPSGYNLIGIGTKK